jgi:hypothetical protein
MELEEISIRDKFEVLKPGKKCVHFSIDDCILGLEEVFESNNESLFDSDYYNFLMNLHNETGAIITCFLFYENKNIYGIKHHFDLSMTDDRYKEEFQRSNHWLKFGIHALNWQTHMNTQTTEQVTKLVNDIYRNITKFAGEDTIAKSWRPHFYAADKDACEIMKKHGIENLFTAEDDRKIVACLQPKLVKQMMKCGFYKDEHLGFLLMRTSFRIEDPSKKLDDLKRIVDEDIDKYGVSAFYTHEYELVKSGENYKSIRNRTQELLKYVKEKGLEFVV